MTLIPFMASVIAAALPTSLAVASQWEDTDTLEVATCCSRSVSAPALVLTKMMPCQLLFSSGSGISPAFELRAMQP